MNGIRSLAGHNADFAQFLVVIILYSVLEIRRLHNYRRFSQLVKNRPCSRIEYNVMIRLIFKRDVVWRLWRCSRTFDSVSLIFSLLRFSRKTAYIVIVSREKAARERKKNVLFPRWVVGSIMDNIVFSINPRTVHDLWRKTCDLAKRFTVRRHAWTLRDRDKHRRGIERKQKTKVMRSVTARLVWNPHFFVWISARRAFRSNIFRVRITKKKKNEDFFFAPPWRPRCHCSAIDFSNFQSNV